MESYDYTPRCNFCSREIAEVSRMIAGDEAHICDHCIDALHEKVHQPAPALADQQSPSGVARLEFYRGKDDRH
jgi:ATP-dependent protease Clp ATPase subunit